MKKILTIGLTLLVTACASSEVTTVAPDAKGQYQAVLDSKYSRQFTDITAQAVRQRFTAGLLMASVDIKNEDLSRKVLQYKFLWFDRDGFEVQPDGRPWTPLTMLGEETKTVQALAPQSNVVTFKIQIEER
jgi:uncharacterized protein YcfL